MRRRIVRYSALLVALSLPIGGCLEQVGTKFNRDPSIDPARSCSRGGYTGGETVGYTCPPSPSVRP